MELTTEQIDSAYRKVWSTVPHAQRLSAFALEIEAEVRKDDTALIRQMVEALDEATTYTASAMWSPSMTNECKELIAKGRTRLEGKPPQAD